jgi:hypothetical protein
LNVWRRAALCAVLSASGLAADSHDADGAPNRAAATRPSKFDYLVLASIADSQRLLTMSAFHTTCARSLQASTSVAQFIL